MPLIKAGLTHRGFALVDVISPCVTFADHEGSTKSYAHTREHGHEVVETDFVPLLHEIQAEQDRRSGDGGDDARRERRAVSDRWMSTTTRPIGTRRIPISRSFRRRGEVATGLLFIEPTSRDLHALQNTVDQPARRCAIRETVPWECRADGASVPLALTGPLRYRCYGSNLRKVLTLEETAMGKLEAIWLKRARGGSDGSSR